MKTAVEWLEIEFKKIPFSNPVDSIKKAKEIEKQQIIDAWEKGYSTGCVVGSNDYTNEDEEKDNGNYYYNQTYNQNK